jgi:hypothetical protein
VEFWANEEVCVLEFEKLGNKLVYFIAWLSLIDLCFNVVNSKRGLLG